MSRNFLTPIVLPAGTASNAPLTLQSGTNLTTPAAGAMEYDGKVVYSTPASRGVSPSMMTYRLNSSLAGANSTGAQSVLGVGVTLAASTVYAFEYSFLFQKTAGATSHQFSTLFGGTATLNNILYQQTSSRAGTATASDYFTTTYAVYVTTASAQPVGTATAFTSTTQVVFGTGTVSVNAGGTFIPQYSLSAAPGGAYSTITGSCFAIWPIGAAGANTSVGPWA